MEDAFAHWRDSSLPDFVFAVKVSRFITHIKRLKNAMPSFTCPVVATADFAYVRFHGSAGLYSSCYSDDELADWAEKLANIATGLTEIYIYFNNDIDGFAVYNAKTLRGYLGGAS